MIALGWRLGAAGVALAIVGGSVWYYGQTRFQAGREAAEADWAAAVAEAGGKFAGALADQQKVLERTETALQRARSDGRQRQEELSDAVRIDPAAAEWAAGRIPDAIRLSLGARDPDVPADP